MPPSRDDFARWRDDPVTRWVMQAHRTLAEDQQREWMGISWGNGSANEAALRELRTRADAYLALPDGTYEAFCETNGDTPHEE